MYHTIGILAHVDAGKTSLSEQILYHTKVIQAPGRVDNQNSFLDTNEIEKQRGITIFSDQACFSYHDLTCFLVDTPGHIDFLSETERAISILDYAVFVLSGTAGIEAHTSVLFRLLEKYKIPVFFFINKMDQAGADLPKVLSGIRQKLHCSPLYLDDILKKENLSETLLEEIASCEESCLEQYLNGTFTKETAFEALPRLFQDRKIFPCMSGSALYDIHISEFLENLSMLMKKIYLSDGNFSGLVYKIRHENQKNPIVFLKVLTGALHVKEELFFPRKASSREDFSMPDANLTGEKIDQIRIYQGNKFTCVKEAYAGQLVGVTGLTIPNCGDFIGTELQLANYEFLPALKVKITALDSTEDKKLLSVLRMLEKEEPLLSVSYDPSLKEIHVHMMGKIQLEVLKQILSNRFSIMAEFGTPEILYKETISAPVMGYGHFEPLRHYAEVNLRLEPLPCGSGIVFESECPTDLLPLHYQNLIRTHIFEKEHKGILTGSALTDVKIILINGKAHIKHTEGGDFREAVYRAVRQGLEKADSILLEPVFQFEIFCPAEYAGRVLSDIQKMHGSFSPIIQENTEIKISGLGPVSKFMNYSMELTSLTKGRGTIQLQLNGYSPCHNAEAVIEKKNYQKDADIQNTSSSVFCKKGQSFIVPWNEAEKFMHCI